jgi:RHO1 GDP-GTP exchange protein 1/2
LYVRRLTPFPDLGCFVDQAGQIGDSIYYIEWERRAVAFVRRGPHLLLFSMGYIEVRHIDTGKLVRMIDVNGLRLLGSGLADWPMPVVAIATKDRSGEQTEKLVELVYNGS